MAFTEKANYVRKRTFPAALIADDNDHPRIQWQAEIKPWRAAGGEATTRFHLNAINIGLLVLLEPIKHGGNYSNIYALQWLV